MNSANRRPPDLRWLTSLVLALASMIIMFRAPILAAASSWPPIATTRSGSFTIAQDDSGWDESEVSPDQVDKYVAVYKAMNRDRRLTVEQAAASQGMTVQAFRELENRIQRDDSALQHARDELQRAALSSTAAPSPPANGTGHSPHN